MRMRVPSPSPARDVHPEIAAEENAKAFLDVADADSFLIDLEEALAGTPKPFSSISMTRRESCEIVRMTDRAVLELRQRGRA